MQRTPTPRQVRAYARAPSPDSQRDTQSRRLQLNSFDLNDWFAEVNDSNPSLDRRLLMLEQKFEINPLDSTSQQALSNKFKIKPHQIIPEVCATSKARYVPLSPSVRNTPSTSRPQSCRASFNLDDVSTGEIKWLEHGKQSNLMQNRMSKPTERRTLSCKPEEFHKMRSFIIPAFDLSSTTTQVRPVKATSKPSSLPFEAEIRDFQVAISSLRTVLKKKRQTSRPPLPYKENLQPSRLNLEQAYLKLVSEIEAVSQKIDSVRLENVWLEEELTRLRC